MNKIAGIFLIIVLLAIATGVRQPVQASNESGFHVATGPTRLDPDLQTALDSLLPDEQMTVIVTLRQQANLSRVSATGRAARLQAVIRALQATANATQESLTQLLNARRSQGLVQRFMPFWVFNGFSVTATSSVINELAHQPNVLSISLDDITVIPVDGAPEPNQSVIQAPALWNLGIYGQGVVVASMDTGVDLFHPDLVNRWREGSNSWYDPYGQHPTTPIDLNGHGTQTMGIMVGGDAGGSWIGVAPGAQWIAVKIFNDRGKSTATAIHNGFQWLLDPDGNQDTPDAPQVVNNSWTFGSPGCNLSFEPDLQALRAAGILPVFAAGNGGPGSNTSYSPANNPSAFAVGATDNDEHIYPYSSRGPSTCGGSTGPFPELVAPGVDINTADLYSSYSTATGTSMAAPHVAGGLALLLSAYPNLEVAEQEQALIQNAVDLGNAGPDDVYGYGRQDLVAAYNWLATLPTPTPAPSATPTLTPTATPVPTNTPTPVPTTSVHVGDLDGTTSSNHAKWGATVTILVYDNNENLASGATVSGEWSDGSTDTCVTGASGTCQVSLNGMNAKYASIIFSVTGVQQASLSYDVNANHDPDGDSDGTSIKIYKP